MIYTLLKSCINALFKYTKYYLTWFDDIFFQISMVIDVCLTALFDAPFVEVVKEAHMQLGRDFSIAKIFFFKFITIFSG